MLGPVYAYLATNDFQHSVDWSLHLMTGIVYKLKSDALVPQESVLVALNYILCDV